MKGTSTSVITHLQVFPAFGGTRSLEAGPKNGKLQCKGHVAASGGYVAVNTVAVYCATGLSHTTVCNSTMPCALLLTTRPHAWLQGKMPFCAPLTVCRAAAMAACILLPWLKPSSLSSLAFQPDKKPHASWMPTQGIVLCCDLQRCICQVHCRLPTSNITQERHPGVIGMQLGKVNPAQHYMLGGAAAGIVSRACCSVDNYSFKGVVCDDFGC